MIGNLWFVKSIGHNRIIVGKTNHKFSKTTQHFCCANKLTSPLILVPKMVGGGGGGCSKVTLL